MINFTLGSARERLDRDEVELMDQAKVLVRDDRRRRPYYFDGRFLAATDLVRDQDYFLTRQADLGRAGGSGVVHGLRVIMGSSATSLRILPGHGITPQGEMVVIRSPIEVDMVDVPKIQRLNGLFGLDREPRRPVRNPSGLFIIALRPVEFFSTSSITAYPTQITGERSLQPDEIIEGAAITLIPYADGRTNSELVRRRAQVATEIFVHGGDQRLPVAALPLAMVALERGFVRWIDEFMVRREVGAEHGDVLGLGFAPRALREAHLLQYNNHLQEVLDGFEGGSIEPFAATDHFQSLPPAGRLPAASINTNDFTQIFFPPEMDVELSVVPEDEVAALLEESLLLPPIDLTMGGDLLESTSVLVLLPVPRKDFHNLSGILTTLRRPLRSAAPGLVARRRPLESLRILKIKRPFLFPEIPGEAAVNTENLSNSEWRDAMTGLETLWYVRRRNLSYKAAVVGIAAPIISGDIDEESLFDSLNGFQSVVRFRELRAKATAEANVEMAALLSADRFKSSRLMMVGALKELEGVEDAKLNRKSVLTVANRFADPQMGAGIERIKARIPEIEAPGIAKAIAESGAVPELDRLARLDIKDEALDAHVTEIIKTAKENPQILAHEIRTRLKGVER